MSKNQTLTPWQVLTSKTIHATNWIKLIEDKCLVSGHEITYTFTKKLDEGPMIIAEDAGKLWLVKQYRHPIKKIVWQFPLEGKTSSENWETAAKRGLAEELSLEAKTWQNLGEFYPDPGGLDQKYQIYLATDLQPTNSKNHQDIDEELIIEKFSRSEIDELIRTGEICDNWTLAGLYIYDNFKRNKLT